MDVKGLRVTIMGLGHFGGGAAAARWLARQGAIVTVTDLADAASLGATLHTLAREPIHALHLGGHRETDFRDADLLVVNPAVPPGNRFVELALGRGVRRTTEIELFLRACPARTVGVTGTNGKSTTAAMTAATLRADGRRAWLGGNIGNSLLDRLAEMTPQDWAVLELSSFQLCHLGEDCPAVDVAVVTNCQPNHLDWHPGFAHYVASKQRLLTAQHSGQVAVLNTADTQVAGWSGLVRGCLREPAPAEEVPQLLLPGKHNRTNAACASAAAASAGCTAAAIRRGLQSFVTLPERLQLVYSLDGRRFYNDSASTTPESTIAALRTLDRPTWLLAGGTAKGADYGAMVEAIADRACGAALFGAMAEPLGRQIAARSPALPCVAAATLAEALAWCWTHSRPGQEILLSPGCASHDQFRNFRHRGETFVQLVRQLAGDGREPRPGT
jgi:UDP-N-acetylmuramoylalanine--D-glutamate ligase